MAATVIDQPATADDVERVARHAGLRYSTDAEPGIARRRQGRGFSYKRADGSTVRDAATRHRIEELAIPPAWQDVWICPDPLGHLQATGRDDRGRKQYRYHADWRRTRDSAKFDRLGDFGSSLLTIRRRVDRDLRRRQVDRERAVATVIRLLDDTLVRVGNEEYAAENGSFGLTTLRRRHVSLDGGGAVLEFPGKSGVDHEVPIDDRRLVRAVRRCHELGGKKLFSYLDADGSLAAVTSGDVNDYLQDTASSELTSKDFRTWGGTAEAIRLLAAAGPPTTAKELDANLLDAIDAAAARLGNTRTVCRNCYVHPSVARWYEDDWLDQAWGRARPSKWYDRAERAAHARLAREPKRAARSSESKRPRP
jgi:DNA topoisomerase-1